MGGYFGRCAWFYYPCDLLVLLSFFCPTYVFTCRVSFDPLESNCIILTFVQERIFSKIQIFNYIGKI